MGTYPMKVLIDEHNNEFVPWVSADCIHTNDGLSFEEKFATKIDSSNLKEGKGITITKNGADCTFDVDFGASDNIIDNLDTTVAGQGPLDARQGNILKNMIPTVVDNLTTADPNKVLSANQGVELKKIAVPEGGSAGQVLKKATDDNHSLEWGDAADPNAIVGDGTIMSIVELSYADYKALEVAGELKADTEYHITDVENGTASYMTKEQIQEMIDIETQDYLPLSGGTITNGLNTPVINFTQGGAVLQKGGHGILRSMGNGDGTALQSLDASSNIKSRLQFDPHLTLNYYYLDGDLNEDTAIWTKLPVGPIKMIEKSITTTQNGTADIEMSADDYIIISTYHPNTAINGLVFNYVYNNKYYIKACSYVDGFEGIGNTTFIIRIFYIDR